MRIKEFIPSRQNGDHEEAATRVASPKVGATLESGVEQRVAAPDDINSKGALLLSPLPHLETRVSQEQREVIECLAGNLRVRGEQVQREFARQTFSWP